jgi:hypothetical protein
MVSIIQPLNHLITGAYARQGCEARVTRRIMKPGRQKVLSPKLPQRPGELAVADSGPPGEDVRQGGQEGIALMQFEGPGGIGYLRQLSIGE